MWFSDGLMTLSIYVVSSSVQSTSYTYLAVILMSIL